MSQIPFESEQLSFLCSIVENRTEFLDSFFLLLNFFDTPPFFLILIPVIWLGFSYQWGLRIYYWLMANNFLLSFAKKSVGWPRPSTQFPELGLLHPTSFGFPSGGAEISFFLGSLWIYFAKNRFERGIAGIYILLVSFSRLYLGVHYPIDILGGWMLGAFVLALFICYNKRLESWICGFEFRQKMVFSLFFPLLIMVLFPFSSIFYWMGGTMGIGVGSLISLKKGWFLSRPKEWKEGSLRAFLGVLILFSLREVLPGEKSAFTAFVIAFFMSTLASPILRFLIPSKKLS